MKGTNLGELEEMVLLIVASLFDNAYGVVIKEEVEAKCQRSITISTVHNVLQRLAEKNFLESRYSDPTPERGGKRKLLFRVTKAGLETLENARAIRDEIWQSIPEMAFHQP